MDLNRFNKRIKSILTKRTKLSAKDADQAIAVASEESRNITDVLVEKDLLSESEYVCAVSMEMNLPPVDADKVHVDEDILNAVPQDVAKYYCILPISKIGKLLTVAVANPFDILKLDDLKLVTGCDIRPVVSTERAIRGAITTNYDRSQEAMAQFMEDIEDPDMIEVSATDDGDEDIDISSLTGETGHPIIKLVNMIIYQAIKEKASDIHIEAFEKKTRIRYRVDGVLKESTSPPKRMHSSLVSRLKIMCGLDIAEKRRPQDGKFQLKVEGRQIDFRVSTLPMVHGEKIVLRILDSSNLALNIDSLGFEEQVVTAVRETITSPYGMMLVTGPTGSGKSTTLYSCLREVLSIEDNIVTVEDPVEYQLDGVNQVPVNVKTGLTFAAALRSILRQDPDIVMIGEIRDLETVEIAVKAALTGHLVFSTLHTNDAPSTITRMIDMGVDPFLVASSVILILAQRLGRKLCPACRQPFEAPQERLVEVGFSEKDIEQEFQLYNAGNCSLCNHGYKGRFAIVEAMKITDPIKRIIIDGGSAMDIKEAAVKGGMITLRHAGLLNAMRGVTTIEEVLNVTMADD